MSYFRTTKFQQQERLKQQGAKTTTTTTTNTTQGTQQSTSNAQKVRHNSQQCSYSNKRRFNNDHSDYNCSMKITQQLGKSTKKLKTEATTAAAATTPTTTDANKYWGFPTLKNPLFHFNTYQYFVL